MLVIYPYKNDILTLADLLVCEGGPRTTLTCKKKKIYIYIYIYTCKIKNIYINNHFKYIYILKYIYIYIHIHILYTKLTYFDYSNKNIEYLYMRIIRI